MGSKSRNKGATFEREIAQELERLTGLVFKRDLEQTRQAQRGDLVTDSPWPFVVECKRYASGGFQSAWWDQAKAAASGVARAGNRPAWPVVIYRFDRQQARVRVNARAIIEAVTWDKWSSQDFQADITLEGLAYLYREWAAGVNR